LKTNNPFLFWVPDEYDPDHFMPWEHPFTSGIAGPTGSGKSMFVRRFIWLGIHHVFHVVNKPSDKHRFSTACRSCNPTGKRMFPWHEMIGIVFVWNPKQKRIIV
jgi:hypothetical protein